MVKLVTLIKEAYFDGKVDENEARKHLNKIGIKKQYIEDIIENWDKELASMEFMFGRDEYKVALGELNKIIHASAKFKNNTPHDKLKEIA